MAKGKKICNCGQVVGARVLVCPTCGHVFGVKKTKIEKVEKVVAEVVAKEVEKGLETLTN